MATLEDSIIYYDGHILFTIRDQHNHRYYAFWADSDAESDILWFVWIDDKRYASLLDGEIDIRQPFFDRPNVLIARRPFSTGEYASAQWVRQEDLDVSCLPPVGDRFGKDSGIYPEALPPDIS